VETNASDHPGGFAFPDSLRACLKALAGAFVPEAEGCSPAQWAVLEGVLGQALAARPARLRRQVLLLIRVLDLLALVRYGRRLPALAAERRLVFLEGLSRAPVLLVRRGIWGLRTLVMMGWYTQPEVRETMGYRATAAGWEGRR